MEQRKRQQNDTIQDYNENKKQKLENKSYILYSNKFLFEDLANEIIYEIFDYLDIYYVYKGFFNLNKRFENLLVNSNLPIQINISTISKLNFEYYHKNIIIPNKHRINILRLSNPFTVDIILSPPRIILQYFQLETLIFDNIKAKYLNNILSHLIFLPKLHSLVLNLVNYVRYPNLLFSHIFRLPKLKYFKITYQTKDDENPSSIYFSNYEPSSIEHLVINSRFRFDEFSDLLICLPQLRYLSINCLDGSTYKDIQLCSIILKNLKYVSLKLDLIHFNQFEQYIKYFFSHVKVLHLTTHYDSAYLDAKRWEQLIVSYMPNLHIFDINHNGYYLEDNPLAYHELIKQFNSSFWIKRQWFFTHQHHCKGRLDGGIFYSINPYRRKDYIFHCELDDKICLNLEETNLNSIKNVNTYHKQSTNNYVNYFPNTTQLTIKYYVEIYDNSLTTILNRIVPLVQLTKFVAYCNNFPFEQVINLLYFTPNLHTIKLNFLIIYQIKAELIQKTDIFQYVSNRNKIKNFEVNERCTLETMELIINLFPQLEYLKTGINRKEINQIIRYLLSNNNKTQHLFFICISKIAKICLRELNILIKLENLLDNYFIKFIDRDLYLWW